MLFQHLGLWDKILVCGHKVKATEQHFPVVLKVLFMSSVNYGVQMNFFFSCKHKNRLVTSEIKAVDQ